MTASDLVKRLLEGNQKTKELLGKKTDSDLPIEVTFRISDEAQDNVAKLLLALCTMGKVGSSRKIEIQDYGTFYWDGDGPDKLDTIKFNGEDIQQLQSAPIETDPTQVPPNETKSQETN